MSLGAASSSPAAKTGVKAEAGESVARPPDQNSAAYPKFLRLDPANPHHFATLLYLNLDKTVTVVFCRKLLPRPPSRACHRFHASAIGTDDWVAVYCSMLSVQLSARLRLVESFDSWRSRLAGDGFLFHFERSCLQGKPATQPWMHESTLRQQTGPLSLVVGKCGRNIRGQARGGGRGSN